MVRGRYLFSISVIRLRHHIHGALLAACIGDIIFHSPLLIFLFIFRLQLGALWRAYNYGTTLRVSALKLELRHILWLKVLLLILKLSLILFFISWLKLICETCLTLGRWSCCTEVILQTPIAILIVLIIITILLSEENLASRFLSLGSLLFFSYDHIKSSVSDGINDALRDHLRYF